MANAKKMTIKKQRSTFSKLLLAFLRRFHLMLFFILVVALLAIGVIMLNQTLTGSSSQDYTPTIHTGSIDEATLNKIQSHHTSSKPATPTIPSGGRINPFAE